MEDYEFGAGEEYCNEPNDVLPPGYEEWEKEFDSRRLYLINAEEHCTHYIMINNLYNVHHKVKLQLDAICQEAGDMNVEEFMQVYKSLEKELFEKIALQPKNPNRGKIPLTGIDRNFQEDMINDMDMGKYD